MHSSIDGFERSDMWREGKWLDLWSVVHLFSGASIGLGLYFLRFAPLAAVSLTLVCLIAYEMWEMVVRIEETPTNRLMDVVVGMTSFLPTFFLVAPTIVGARLVLAFAIVFTINVTLSVFGWRASQKAAALEARMRARFIEQEAQLRKRFRDRRRARVGNGLVKRSVRHG